MARNVIVNGSGAKEIFVNDGSSWQTVKEVWIKNGGSWVQCFPATGTQTYSTAGTYSFTVPNGIYSLSVPLLVGAGGGGGGFNTTGDVRQGGSGGSGGYYSSQTLDVTPGEILTVTVGAGGLAGYRRFNGVSVCTSGTNTKDGAAGGDTSIKRGATELLKATGGGGGTGSSGGSGAAGTAGSPNGVAGQTGTGFNTFSAKPGGSNGTGYGTGGYSNGDNSIDCATPGDAGYVSLSW